MFKSYNKLHSIQAVKAQILLEISSLRHLPIYARKWILVSILIKISDSYQRERFKNGKAKKVTLTTHMKLGATKYPVNILIRSLSEIPYSSRLSDDINCQCFGSNILKADIIEALYSNRDANFK